MKLKEPRACNASTKRRLNPYRLSLRLDKDILMKMLRMFLALGLSHFTLSALKALSTTNKGLFSIIKPMIEDTFAFLLRGSICMRSYYPQHVVIHRSNKDFVRVLEAAHGYIALKHMSCYLDESMFAMIPALPSLTSLNITQSAKFLSHGTGIIPLPDNVLHLRIQGYISNFNILPKFLQTLHVCFYTNAREDYHQSPLVYTEELPHSLKHLLICAEEVWPVHIRTALPENLETLELVNCTVLERLYHMRSLKAVKFAHCFTTEVPRLSDSIETMIFLSKNKINLSTLPSSLKHLIVDANVMIENSLRDAQNLKFLKAYRNSFIDLPPNLEELDIQGENAHIDLNFPSSLKTMYMAILTYNIDVRIAPVDSKITVILYGTWYDACQEILIPIKEFQSKFTNFSQAFYFQGRSQRYWYPLENYKSRCSGSEVCTEGSDYYPRLKASILKQ